MLRIIRSLQQKPVTQTCGHSICLPFYELRFFDEKFLVASDFHTLFGGYATSIWMPSLVEPGLASLLGRCLITT